MSVDNESQLRELDEEAELVNVECLKETDHIVQVELDRAEVMNALNTQLREELKTVLGTLDDSDWIRVVIITGAEESNAFSAGGDVTELRKKDAIRQLKRIDQTRIFHFIYELTVPIIARINGPAIGGGCELAQACDIRIATEDATFGQPETNIGLFPGAGATQWLPRLVGRGNAMKLILSGETIDAKEAKEIGLIEEHYPNTSALDERIHELATNIADRAPLGVQFAKRSIKASERMTVQNGLDYEALLYAHLFNTDDKDEGIDAFLDKREPEWEGR